MITRNAIEGSKRKTSFWNRLFSSFHDREDHGAAPGFEMLEARVMLSASPLPDPYIDEGHQYLNDQAVICMPLSVDNTDAAAPAADQVAEDSAATEIEPVLVQTVTAAAADDVNAPVITVNPADGYIHKSTVAVKVRITDSDSATVNWTVKLINHNTGEATTVGSGDSPVTSWATLATITTANYADGVYTILVEATDAAGNRSEKAQSFTLDSTPPEVSIAAETERFEVGTIAFNVAATDATGIAARTLTINGRSVAVNATSGRAVYTFTQPGTYTLVATATDRAYNRSTVTRTVVITENTDFTAPTIDIVSPASGSYTNANKVSLIASIDDAEGGYIGWTVRLCQPNGTKGIIATGEGAVFNAEIASRNVMEGTNVFEIEAVDAAGNVTVATRIFNVDRSKPTVGIGFADGPTSYATWRTEPFTITGIIRDNYSPIEQVSWTLTMTNVNTGHSFVYATGHGVPANGAFATINPSDFIGGEYTFTLEATDLAGNVDSRKLEVKMDGIRPDFSYGYSWNQQGRLIVDILASDDYGLSNANLIALGSPSTETRPPSPTAGGGVSFLDSGHAQINMGFIESGTYVLQLCVSDKAGNISYTVFTVRTPW